MEELGKLLRALNWLAWTAVVWMISVALLLFGHWFFGILGFVLVLILLFAPMYQVSASAR